jgi:DNA-binding MarR family transcriptional regulator
MPNPAAARKKRQADNVQEVAPQRRRQRSSANPSSVEDSVPANTGTGKTDTSLPSQEKEKGIVAKDQGRPVDIDGKPLSRGILETFLGNTLKLALLRREAELGKTLDELDLRRGQFSALALIIENPRVSQKGLARILSIEPSNLVSILDNLEGRGLIARNRFLDDRRTYALTATQKGKEICDVAIERIREHEARIFAKLSKSEQKTLFELLNKVGR